MAALATMRLPLMVALFGGWLEVQAVAFGNHDILTKVVGWGSAIDVSKMEQYDLSTVTQLIACGGDVNDDRSFKPACEAAYVLKAVAYAAKHNVTILIGATTSMAMAIQKIRAPHFCATQQHGSYMRILWQTM